MSHCFEISVFGTIQGVYVARCMVRLAPLSDVLKLSALTCADAVRRLGEGEGSMQFLRCVGMACNVL